MSISMHFCSLSDVSDPTPNSSLGRHRPLMKNHPRRPETVPQHAEPGGKERIRHRHKDLAAVGQQLEDALRLCIAVDAERKINTAHRLKTLWRHIAAHQ